VTRLLEEHFPRLVDYDFTASMEEDLDRIAAVIDVAGGRARVGGARSRGGGAARGAGA